MALEEGPVVVAGEKTRLLALAARGGREPGALGLVAGLRLRLRRRGGTRRGRGAPGATVASMYDWSFARVDAARDQPPSVAFGDRRVVARPERVRSCPLGERDERVESEAAVAARARIRGQTRRVVVDERLDDPGAELLAQVERDMREPGPVTGVAGGDHRRSASSRRARRSGPAGSCQSRSVTPTASDPARSSVTALSTPPLIATAIRPGPGCAAKTPPIAFASASSRAPRPAPPLPRAASGRRERGSARAHPPRRCGLRRPRVGTPRTPRRARCRRSVRRRAITPGYRRLCRIRVSRTASRSPGSRPDQLCGRGDRSVRTGDPCSSAGCRSPR